jgi:hypothetical protein
MSTPHTRVLFFHDTNLGVSARQDGRQLQNHERRARLARRFANETGLLETIAGAFAEDPRVSLR